MKSSNFSVLCVKRSEGKFGLTVFFQPTTTVCPLLPELKEIKFSDEEVREKFVKKMEEVIGYWHGCCHSSGLKISDIHLIFPPDFEAHTLKTGLKTFLLQQYGIDLKIDIGMQINEINLAESAKLNYPHIYQLLLIDSKLN